MQRPDWVDSELYPFEDRWTDADACMVHNVDEGDGPPLLMIHGNPTWSFTWRGVIEGLRDRYRCIAIDLPGFGLSTARPGYGFTAAEHATVVEAFVRKLDLQGVTLMVQDWGGPIGFRVATREPERFSAFVIGNTWAWSMKDNRAARVFSGFLGGPVGRFLNLRRNFFVERIIPRATREKLPDAVMDMYRGPFPTPESRKPVAVFPKEIIRATPWLEEIDRDLQRVSDRPALIVWPTRDQAFREPERERWESIFPDHRTVLLEGAQHYIGEDAPGEIVQAVREWSTGPGVSEA